MNGQKRGATFLILLLLGSFLLFLISCGQENPQGIPKEFSLEDFKGKNNIILKVEDHFYFNSDFEKYVRSIVGNSQLTLTFSSLSRLYDRFVDERIFLQAAKNQKISLTWEERKEYLAKLASEFRSEEKEVSLEELDTQLFFDKMLIKKFTHQLVEDVEVKEDEIQEYYNLNKKEFLQAEQVRVSQILVKSKDKATEVLDKVNKSSEEEFRKIAQAYSIGLEAARGGDMGWFEMGQLPREMETAIFSLKEGELSLVVESSYGYHIFRVDERSGLEIISLEKASSAIKLKLLDQKIRKKISQHLDDLKKNLGWNSHPGNLPFPYERKIS